MPEYLYLCEVSNEEFETEHSIKIELEECLVCKKKELPTHKPKRLIAGKTLGVVDYTGHELMQKTKEDAAKLKKEVYGSEKGYSSVIGEQRYHDIQTRMDRRNK